MGCRFTETLKSECSLNKLRSGHPLTGREGSDGTDTVGASKLNQSFGGIFFYDYFLYQGSLTCFVPICAKAPKPFSDYYSPYINPNPIRPRRKFSFLASAAASMISFHVLKAACSALVAEPANTRACSFQGASKLPTALGLPTLRRRCGYFQPMLQHQSARHRTSHQKSGQGRQGVKRRVPDMPIVDHEPARGLKATKSPFLIFLPFLLSSSEHRYLSTHGC